jgi:hypothetical protein
LFDFDVKQGRAELVTSDHGEGLTNTAGRMNLSPQRPYNDVKADERLILKQENGTSLQSAESPFAAHYKCLDRAQNMEVARPS